MKYTTDYLTKIYEIASQRIISNDNFRKQSKGPFDELLNSRFLIHWTEELIKIFFCMGKYDECVQTMRTIVEEAINICKRLNHFIINDLNTQENELDVIALPAFQAGTIMGLREQMVELAQHAEGKKVTKPFYLDPIYYHTCFYRYYYLNNTELRDEAIRKLLTVKRPRYGTSLAAYEFSPKAMSEALIAIFEKNDESFNFHMKRILKWHERAADKKLTKTGNTVISMLLSLPAAAVIRLAKDHGINVTIKSDAVPEEIFQLRNYLT